MKGAGLPFEGFSEEESQGIEIIVSDVDDTITNSGKLLPEALAALWEAKRAGKMIVLVTGGSAGWADAYIRQWPVDLVIAEGGALALAHGKDDSIVYKFNPHIAPDAKKKRENLLKATAGLILSSDQYARVHDIAYDKSKLSSYELKTLLSVVQAMGGHASVSSIHVNVGFGKFSKASSYIMFMSTLFDMQYPSVVTKSVYFGDSLNDEDMFRLFPLSVGMHSVEDARDSFEILPRYITAEYGGRGFSRAIHSLLEANS